MILKADGEYAIGDLLSEVARERGCLGTAIERSPTGSSSSNGLAERAVQSLEEKMRTIKLDLEERVQGEVSVLWTAMEWLPTYAADMLNKYQVGKDRKTAYERIYGKPYRGEVYEFLSPILHRVIGGIRGGEMQERWLEGLYLGKLWGSDEFIISTNDGKVVRARAVTPRPNGVQLTTEMIRTVQGHPWNPTGVITHADVRPTAAPVPMQPNPATPKVPIPRGFRITERMLKKFGYTEGCPHCRALERGDNRGTSHHSKACRTRLEELIADDAEFGDAILGADQRANEYLARRVEESAQGQEAAPSGSLGRGTRTEGEMAAKGDRFMEEHANADDATAKRRRLDDESPREYPGGDSHAASSSSVPLSGGYRAREQDEPVENKRRRQELLGLHDSHQSRFDVCEVFSPPRTTTRANATGFRGGWACDYRYEDPLTGRKYDLLTARDQKEVRRLLRRDCPELLTCSPPCTVFSQANTTGKQTAREMAEAVEMIRFSLELCRIQHVAGRAFIFEHPLGARTWKLPVVQQFMNDLEVYVANFHQCQYGQVARKSNGETGAVLKPTRLLTNRWVFVDLFSRRCPRDHVHVHLQGGLTTKAASYTDEMCDVMLEGVALLKAARPEALDSNLSALEELHEDDYRDDYRPEEFDVDANDEPVLDERLVMEGKTEELQYMKHVGVWKVEARSKVLARNPRAKIIGTKWVVKATNDYSGAKCRLVGQEFASRDKREDLFAGTPPLSAMRWLLSRAMSKGRASRRPKIGILDIRKAFLHGYIERELYVELPVEDPDSDGGRNIGRLVRSLYGTRDAPMAWQKVVREFMNKLNFPASPISAGVYWHSGRDLQVISHVDDFLIIGDEGDVKWLIAEIESCFEAKSKVLGFGPNDDTVGQFLKREIRVIRNGIVIEGDQNHVHQLLKEAGMVDCKGVDTPGVKHEVAVESPVLEPADASQFRRAAAVINYISQDRPDLCFTSRQICKGMASPRQCDILTLKRCLRYLRKHPRVALHYGIQDMPTHLDVFSDSDWANDTVTRRSTSGGLVRHGGHSIAWWSKLQARVALSSCEAEVNGLVKAASEGLYLQRLAGTLGAQTSLRLQTDASAAKGVLMRNGCGKLKHLSAKQLWVQEHVERREIEIEKIPRSSNYADVLTHCWENKDFWMFLDTGFVFPGPDPH